MTGIDNSMGAQVCLTCGWESCPCGSLRRGSHSAAFHHEHRKKKSHNPPDAPRRRRNPRAPRPRRLRVAYPNANAPAPHANASSHGDPASSAYVDAGSDMDAYANPTPRAYVDARPHMDAYANSSAYLDANSHMDAGAYSGANSNAYANPCSLRRRRVFRRQDDSYQGRGEPGRRLRRVQQTRRGRSQELLP